MTRREIEILLWLSSEGRPVTHLLALPFEQLIAWVKAHGGKLVHQDAAIGMRDALRGRVNVAVYDATAVSNNIAQFAARRAQA